MSNEPKFIDTLRQDYQVSLEEHNRREAERNRLEVQRQRTNALAMLRNLILGGNKAPPTEVIVRSLTQEMALFYRTLYLENDLTVGEVYKEEIADYDGTTEINYCIKVSGWA